MERGLEVDLHLRPGLTDEDFVGELLGNLAAFELVRSRPERLEWQVLRVYGKGPHHFRLVLRHPDHVLDLGLRRQLDRTLDELSAQSIEELRARRDDALAHGLHVVPLRHVHESVDFWQDDFWNWIG